MVVKSAVNVVSGLLFNTVIRFFFVIKFVWRER